MGTMLRNARTLVLVWLLLVLSGLCLAETGAPLAGETVWVKLFAWQTPAEGAKRRAGGAGSPAEKGSTGVLYLTSGRFSDGNAAAPLVTKSAGSGGSDLDALIRSAPTVWVVRRKLLSATVDKITIEVDWARYRSEIEGRPQQVAGDKHIVRLRPGQRHVLDFLENPLAEGTEPRNLFVELGAELKENAELENVVLEYDLWLNIKDRNGNRESFQQVVMGTQGEETAFRFAPRRWRLSGLSSSIQGEVIADISGSMLGRLRTDGSIVLVLDATRQLGVALAGIPWSGRVGDGGRKTFSLLPSETVSLMLPAARGQAFGQRGPEGSKGAVTSGALLDDVDDPGGVIIRGSKFGADFRKFFAGYEFSLTLTVRPL